ncbi:hypothetical protein DL95DRAFT_463701 [Leptodontidium sp. 2 PMI_412]|nr:hypothetical protein DL95DRAFT_463701 [Leptodontidium sp. 2 PMI_412]
MASLATLDHSLHVSSSRQASTNRRRWEIPRLAISFILYDPVSHTLDKNVLENDEAWAKKNGQKITLYAPIVRKERERLEEFERSNVRPKDSDTKEILDTVSGLEKALKQTLEDVEVKEKPEGKLGGKSYTDVKFSGRETDQKLPELLNVFRDSNAALWSH